MTLEKQHISKKQMHFNNGIKACNFYNSHTQAGGPRTVN